ncbi:hypothetical protein [Acinetobacter baumannii]|nr:hypothetical protein [Acinetobacter baumannii]
MPDVLRRKRALLNIDYWRGFYLIILDQLFLFQEKYMCDSFEKIISLLANIATILGAILAFVVWSTWKEQQNYSFTRDKIFKC